MTKLVQPRPGERARCVRVAMMLADVIREMNLPPWGSRLSWLRGLALKLKSMRLHLRDLDRDNGQDAIAAIARALPLRDWKHLASSDACVLGKKWSWIVAHAGRELHRDRKRAPPQLSTRSSIPGSTTPTATTPITIVRYSNGD